MRDITIMSKESIEQNVETPKVSIIEDNKLIRENVSKYIGMHDEFEMQEVFGSVESFYFKLDGNPNFEIDVLLLDIGLPGISGLEAIPEILKRKPGLEIIMLTTYEEEETILKALCSGASSYLSKKARLQEIVDAVRIVIKGGSYMSPSIAREIINHLMGGNVKKNPLGLTSRQEEILQFLSEGKSYREISSLLFISIETVRSHVKKLYKTMQVSNKVEAVRKYLNA